MKIQKILLALTLVSFLAIGCKNEAKKEDAKEQKTEVAANPKELSLNISGMTCEIGCARKIASDLSKKEGVLDAKVVFTDSIATIKYDANITNKADLVAFVEGIGSGDMYKASEANKKDCKKTCDKKDKDAKACKASCDKEGKDAKACEADCKKKCSSKDGADKKTCEADCKKACCADLKKA